MLLPSPNGRRRLLRHAPHRAHSTMQLLVFLVPLIVAAGLLGVAWRTFHHAQFPVVPGASALVYELNGDDGGSQLFAMAADGSHSTRLTYFVNQDLPWRWSLWYFTVRNWVSNSQPHAGQAAQQIVFVSDLAGDDAFYRLNLDRTHFSRLEVPPTLDARRAVPAPSGQLFAFARDDGKLRVTNRDGTMERCLTCDLTGSVADIAWSPDGHTLAFAVFNGQERSENIYRVQVDGAQLVKLTHARVRWNSEPAWSPDGRQLAYRSLLRGRSDLFTMSADGGDNRRLTTTGTEFSPAWSPDGTTIAFVSRRDHTGAEIYVMQADGSAPRRLTTTPEDEGAPVWIPM